MCAIILLGSAHYGYAMFPINYFRAWDLNVVKPYHANGALLDFACTPEFGLSTKGKTACDQPCLHPKYGHDVNVLQLYQPEQDALAMLKGFSSSSAIGTLAQELNVDDDNGVRGHISFCGDLDIKCNAIFSSRFYLNHNFIVSVMVPVVALKMSTKFTDLTPMVTEEDFLTHSLLTDNFAANVKSLGDGLDINGWERTGLGDIAALIEWNKDFPQAKPLLKNVATHVRMGMSFPTGKGINPDQIMSVPLGNDGAFGVLFDAGLDLSLVTYVNLGVEVEFLFLFGNTRERRIKTDTSQTDLILLAKTCVYKDFGLTQFFNVYAEIYKLWNRFTFRFTYQFWKHDDDKLTVVNNDFSSIPANTAKSLEEWTIHQFIYNLSYDFDYDVSDKSPVLPYVALFYKQPINGKNALLAKTIGFIASITY